MFVRLSGPRIKPKGGRAGGWHLVGGGGQGSNLDRVACSGLNIIMFGRVGSYYDSTDSIHHLVQLALEKKIVLSSLPAQHSCLWTDYT